MVVSRWSEKELRNLEKGDFDFDTIGLRGRDGTKEDIDSFVSGVVVDRQNHGEYPVLIASGHVRSGKTRIGQEVFKRVSEIVRCSDGFNSSFYLPVNLGNGLGFAASFDGHVTPSEALGARIINGYIGNHTTLKAVAADKAIDVIAGEGEEERRQPVVVHIDEHGQYARRWENYIKLQSKQQSRERDDDDLDFIEQGRQKLVDMVDTLVGIATNSDRRYRRTIIVVLSGTSYGDISPRHDSMYQLLRLKLPMLNPRMCLELASERIDSKLENLSSLNIQLPDKEDIVDSTLFKVALADTGGLPGWVVELGSLACNSNVWKTGSYVSAIHDAVKRYLKAPNHDRVKISMLVGFARPPIAMSTELLQEYVETSGSKRRRRAWTVHARCFRQRQCQCS